MNIRSEDLLKLLSIIIYTSLYTNPPHYLTIWIKNRQDRKLYSAKWDNCSKLIKYDGLNSSLVKI